MRLAMAAHGNDVLLLLRRRPSGREQGKREPHGKPDLHGTLLQFAAIMTRRQGRTWAI